MLLNQLTQNLPVWLSVPLEYGVLSFCLPLGSLWSDRLHRYPWGQSELLLLQAASSVCSWKTCVFSSRVQPSYIRNTTEIKYVAYAMQWKPGSKNGTCCMIVNVWDFRKYLHCLCNRIYGTQVWIRIKFCIQCLLLTCITNFHQNLLRDFGDKTDVYRRAIWH